MKEKSKLLILGVSVNFLLQLVVAALPGYTNDYLAVKDSGFTGLPVNVRAKGMAEAFVAVADDYGGGYFNPAGLVQIERREIGTMYSDLYALGLLEHSFLCYAEPAADNRAGGEISWNHLSANLEPEKWNYDLFCYSYGRLFSGRGSSSPAKFNAWGVNLKYLRQTIDSEEDATGYSLDLGFLMRRDRFSGGINLQNLLSQVDYQTGKRESIPLSVRIGTAYRLTPQLLLALDVNASPEDLPREVCLGVEWWLSDWIALRLGAVKIFQKEPDLGFSGGVGVSLPLQGDVKVVKRIGLDYAFSSNEALGSTHHFSLSLEF